MKLQSNKVKNQVLNMIQPVGKITFDKDGFCEVPDDQVDIVLDNYAHLGFVDKRVKKTIEKTKEQKPFDVKDFSFSNEQIGSVRTFGLVGLAQIVVEMGKEVSHDELTLLHQHVLQLPFVENQGAGEVHIKSFREQTLFSLTTEEFEYVQDNGQEGLEIILNRKGVQFDKKELEFWTTNIQDEKKDSEKKDQEIEFSIEEQDAIKTIEDLEKLLASKQIPFDNESLQVQFKKVFDLKEARIKEAKAASIEKINKLNSVAKLKELCEDFPKEEWSGLKTVEDFKNYIISKL